MKSGNISLISQCVDISGNGVSGLTAFDSIQLVNGTHSLSVITPVEITGGPIGYYSFGYDVIPGDTTIQLYHATNSFNPSQFLFESVTIYDDDDVYARVGSLTGVTPVIFPQSNYAEYPSITLSDVDWETEISIPDYIVGSTPVSGWTMTGEARPVWASTYPLSAAAPLAATVTFIGESFIKVAIDKSLIPGSIIPTSWPEIVYNVDVKATLPNSDIIKPARVTLTIRRSSIE